MYSPDILNKYFKRSYFAVDGLWFMKVEEMYGFDSALNIDVKVWEILPKIQAREVRKLLMIKDDGIEPLFKALQLKLEAEGYVYSIDHKQGVIEIRQCPWIKLLEKSGRTHLKEKIGGVICSTEFRTWGGEFNVSGFKLDNRGCCEGGNCRLFFSNQSE